MLRPFGMLQLCSCVSVFGAFGMLSFVNPCRTTTESNVNADHADHYPSGKTY